MAVDQQLAAKGERELFTHAFRDFKGVYTKSDRSAMVGDHSDYFYHLENLQPIGAANVHSVPDKSASLHDFAGDTIYAAQFGQVTTNPYLFTYAANGKTFSFRTDTNATAQINGGQLFSGAGSRMSQWMNKYAIFSDTTGIYTWDGTTLTKMVGGAQPTGGSDVCVAFNRVWVASGRLILYSAANDGTATTDPINNSAWLAANGAGALNLTDPTLSGSVTRLWAQNGYLYICGATCVYALADVYVPAGASPPTPLYTLVPIQSIIGTDQPFSVFPYNRSLMFANRYGGWIIDGVNALRVSEDIDGTWQYLSFNPAISGGQCVVNNILCAAFLMQRLSDPVFGSNTVIGLWFNGLWWFANFGAVTFLTTAIIGNVPTLMAFIGNQLYSLFTNSATNPDGIAITALWDMDDPLSDKAVIRAGAQIIAFQPGAAVTLSIDGSNKTQLFKSQTAVAAILQFVNNSGGPIVFTGLGGAPIYWITDKAYVLVNGSTPGAWSPYVGMTMKFHNSNVQISGFFMDYKKGARWGT
jgi:hypothetical protein